jgi:putative membrane protein
MPARQSFFRGDGRRQPAVAPDPSGVCLVAGNDAEVGPPAPILPCLGSRENLKPVLVTSENSAARRPLVHSAGIFLLAVSLAATIAMVFWWGAGGIGRAVWRAMPSLPWALCVHAVQLGLSGLGWWCLLKQPKPPRLLVMRARWVREAVNTLLPLGGLSGAVLATRLLARDAKLRMAYAAVTTTADLTCEAAAQAPYLVATLVIAALLAPGQVTAARAALALLPVVLGVLAFFAAQRAGLMRLIERAAPRLGFGAAMEGLHDGLMALHAQPGQIVRAISLHSLSWSLGGAEVWIILHAIGQPVGAGAAFAIEGVGMAARSMGFALPVGLAAQEAGFVLGAGLFGVPAQDAIALSMLKRVRELVLAVSGVGVWQIAIWRR